MHVHMELTCQKISTLNYIFILFVLPTLKLFSRHVRFIKNIKRNLTITIITSNQIRFT